MSRANVQTRSVPASNRQKNHGAQGGAVVIVHIVQIQEEPQHASFAGEDDKELPDVLGRVFVLKKKAIREAEEYMDRNSQERHWRKEQQDKVEEKNAEKRINIEKEAPWKKGHIWEQMKCKIAFRFLESGMKMKTSWRTHGRTFERVTLIHAESLSPHPMKRRVVIEGDSVLCEIKTEIYCKDPEIHQVCVLTGGQNRECGGRVAITHKSNGCISLSSHQCGSNVDPRGTTKKNSSDLGHQIVFLSMLLVLRKELERKRKILQLSNWL